MVKAYYLCLNDDMSEEILESIHQQAINNDTNFVLKENDDFKKQPMFEKAKTKDFGDGIKIMYSDYYMCTADPLGLLTHVLIIKEVA